MKGKHFPENKLTPFQNTYGEESSDEPFILVFTLEVQWFMRQIGYKNRNYYDSDILDMIMLCRHVVNQTKAK